MKVILDNQENKEIVLFELSHIVLPVGKIEFEMSERRLQIALKEILDRNLKIERVSETTEKTTKTKKEKE